MQDQILRLPQVQQVTGLSKSSIYAFVKEGKFPPPVQLSARAVGWSSSSVQEWIRQRIGGSGVEQS